MSKKNVKKKARKKLCLSKWKWVALYRVHCPLCGQHSEGGGR